MAFCLRVNFSRSDQETLARLKMRPAFVGIERRLLNFAILGDISAIKNHSQYARTYEKERAPIGPRDDGAGGWIVRLEEDAARLE